MPSLPRTLPLVLATLALAACTGDPPVAPGPRMPAAPRALSAAIARPALQPALDAVATAPVARVEIVPDHMQIVYDSAPQVVDREFSAIAYDAAGNVLADRAVTWTDETGWHPSYPLATPSPSAVRLSLPYANAAAPALSPSGDCVLAWKGIRATIEGVTAIAPICGTFAVAVRSERRTGLVPVTGDTITLGAGQQCRVTALATGGHGFYDYAWSLDGVDLGEGETLVLHTGTVDTVRTLVLRVSDEGHDISPYRLMRFAVRIDASGSADLDC